MTVYILHFNEPVGHAQHYVGFCEEGNLEKRLETHRKGHGSRLVAELMRRGLDFELAKFYVGKSRKFERMLKRQRNTRRYCPVCTPNAREFKHE